MLSSYTLIQLYSYNLLYSLTALYQLYINTSNVLYSQCVIQLHRYNGLKPKERVRAIEVGIWRACDSASITSVPARFRVCDVLSRPVCNTEWLHV